MKSWFLLITLTATTLAVQAAPPKKAVRPQWEYAVLDMGSAYASGNTFLYRPKLSLPGNKTVELSVPDAQSPQYKAYLFNRLGGQGWELITANGYSGSTTQFIFKRRK